jgi:hypothetical protein
MMVSMWWLVVAFMLGGFAGTLVLAMLAVARSEQDLGTRSEDAVARDGLGAVGLEPTLTAK